MTATPLELLTPGIKNIFEPLGFRCHVYDFDGKCQVALYKGEFSEVRAFPWPSTNVELATPLLAWRDELKGAGA